MYAIKCCCLVHMERTSHLLFFAIDYIFIRIEFLIFISVFDILSYILSLPEWRGLATNNACKLSISKPSRYQKYRLVLALCIWISQHELLRVRTTFWVTCLAAINSKINIIYWYNTTGEKCHPISPSQSIRLRFFYSV